MQHLEKGGQQRHLRHATAGQASGVERLTPGQTQPFVVPAPFCQATGS